MCGSFRDGEPSENSILLAPLCQEAVCEAICESVTSSLNTVSEMRRLRQRIASLRDLPSASFLLWYGPPRISLQAWQTAIMCMTKVEATVPREREPVPEHFPA